MRAHQHRSLTAAFRLLPAVLLPAGLAGASDSVPTADEIAQFRAQLAAQQAEIRELRGESNPQTAEAPEAARTAPAPPLPATPVASMAAPRDNVAHYKRTSGPRPSLPSASRTSPRSTSSFSHNRTMGINCGAGWQPAWAAFETRPLAIGNRSQRLCLQRDTGGFANPPQVATCPTIYADT